MPDLPAFVRHIGGVLEGRLAQSVAVGHSGALRLSFFGDGLLLRFEGGRLAEVAPCPHFLSAEEAGPQGARFPDLTFLQLLFGCRSLEEPSRARRPPRRHRGGAGAAECPLPQAAFPDLAGLVAGRGASLRGPDRKLASAGVAGVQAGLEVRQVVTGYHGGEWPPGARERRGARRSASDDREQLVPYAGAGALSESPAPEGRPRRCTPSPGAVTRPARETVEALRRIGSATAMRRAEPPRLQGLHHHRPHPWTPGRRWWARP